MKILDYPMSNQQNGIVMVTKETLVNVWQEAEPRNRLESLPSIDIILTRKAGFPMATKEAIG